MRPQNHSKYSLQLSIKIKFYQIRYNKVYAGYYLALMWDSSKKHRGFWGWGFTLVILVLGKWRQEDFCDLT